MSPRARLLLVIGLLAFAAIAVRLGFWQLDRLAQRRAANSAALRARRAPELDLATWTGQTLDQRRVRATGTYDRAHELVIREQVYHDVPGVVLVTPLRLAESGDRAVLVERGFVPSPDAVTLPPVADSLDETGVEQVHGIALPLTAEPDGGGPLEHEGRTTWKQLDLAAVRARLPYPILSVVIRQTPDSALPRLPRRRELRPLDDGPHLSYAIQWFAFAATAVVFGGVFLTQRGR